jgi:hypothetical protein
MKWRDEKPTRDFLKIAFSQLLAVGRFMKTPVLV